MHTDTLRGIAGIDIFPVISLLVFVAVFTAVLIYAMRLERSRVDRLSRLPLDEDGACRKCGRCGEPGACGTETVR
jgi:hypothetical protein